MTFRPGLRSLAERFDDELRFIKGWIDKPRAVGVARELVKLGGQPKLREGFVTDNGNVILDVAGLDIVDPVAMESKINQIAGVVTNGLFAARPASVLLLATADGVKTYQR